MNELEPPCVQQGTWGFESGFFGQTAIVFRTISLIADERKANVQKMHPDLVRPAGVERRFDISGGVQLLADAVTGPCLTPRIIRGRHALAMGRMAGDGGPNLAGSMRQISANDGQVGFVETPLGELPGQRDVRRIVLCDHQTAAGVFIEAVNDARPGDTADAAELALAVVQERINERVFLVARRRVDDHPRGFINHQQILVFVEDV